MQLRKSIARLRALVTASPSVPSAANGAHAPDVVRKEQNEIAPTRPRPWIKLSVGLRDEFLASLKGPQLSVFLCVALHMNSEFKSWPGIRLIEHETGYSGKTVINAIRKLEADGILSVERHKFIPGKGRKVNTYTVEALAAYGVETPTQGTLHNPYVGATETQSPETQQTSTEEEPVQEEPVEEEPENIYTALRARHVFPATARKLLQQFLPSQIKTTLSNGLTGGELVALIRGEWQEPDKQESSDLRNYREGFEDFWDA